MSLNIKKEVARILEDIGFAEALERLCADGSPPATCGLLGHWQSVAEAMPDDGITCLVWSEHLDDATLASHHSEVRERRGDSGWVQVGSPFVLLGVTHWCADILPPREPQEADEPKQPSEPS